MSVLHDSGEQNIGDIYLRNVAQNANLLLGLYSNAIALAETDTIAQVVEISGNGYARIMLPAIDWIRQSSQTAENGTRYDQPRRAFQFTGAVGVVTGYFIVTPANVLIASAHFPTSVNVNQAGFEIGIVAQMQFR